MDDPRDAGPIAHVEARVRGLSPSATLAINERSAALAAAGKTIYRLGLGQSPFPVPEPVVEALRQNAWRKDYLPVQGLPELRRAVAAHHRRVYGGEYAAENILVGPGSKELLFLLQLVYGGELVLPSPSWVSYAPQARILGRPIHYLPTRVEDGWRLDPAELDRFCRRGAARPRLLLLNYPSNPTGMSYPRAALAALARVARRHRLLVVSDEIYGKLDHDGDHVSIATLYPEGTVLSSGLSKWCGAGGWRLGVVALPAGLDRLGAALRAVASETYTTASAPVQYAAVRAYEGGEEIERYLAHSRRILRALGGWAAAELAAAGAAVAPPDGGFYLFPDLTPLAPALRARGIASGAELCARLLEETGVATLPGSDFGRPPEELTFRLAYVDFDGGAALAAAAERDGELGMDFLHAACGPTVTALERLRGWLERR